MTIRFAHVGLVVAGCIWGGSAQGQVISVKTIPVAETEQFAFLPTSGRTTMSMVLVDSLRDPFDNPAKGSLLKRSQYFGAPSFFSVTGNTGGGTTFPMGALFRRGSTFAGLAVAFQQIDRANPNAFFGPFFDPVTGSFMGEPDPQSPQNNRYSFAMFGHSIDSGRVSIGGSVLWSSLNSIDGTDQFYDGNQSLSQFGDAVDVRLGVTTRLRKGRSLEAILLRNHFAMSDEIGFIDVFWDPATRSNRPRPRVETNNARSNVWGLHLEYEHPLDSGWRVGALATTNLIRHPRIPTYAVTSGLGSRGTATAFNFGLGVGQSKKLYTLGIDAIYEPIVNHSGIADTVDNRFRFHNAKVRGGVSRDFPLLTPGNYVRVQLGGELHWINYRLRQDDHVNGLTQRRSEHWLERTRNGGVSFITNGLQMHYLASSRNGVGRPGVVNNDGSFFGPDILSSTTWGGPITAPVGLGSVSSMRHQFSISVPVR